MGDVVVQHEMNKTEAWLWNENKELLKETRELRKDNKKLLDVLEKVCSIALKVDKKEKENGKGK